MLFPILTEPLFDILLPLIIEQYLTETYCLTFVSERGLNFKSYPYTFSHIKVNNDTDLVNELLLLSEMGCSDYIIQMSETRFLQAFDEVNHIATVRRSDKKLIFLSTNNILNILAMKETSYIANVLFIIKSDAEKSDCEIYDFYTHKYVGLTDTDKPILLDQWSSCTNNFTNNNNLFPHTMDNLEGKVVKVAAFTYKPYVLLDLDKSIAPYGRDGFEMRLIDEFCRRLNCTVELVRDDDGQWGEIFDNRTGNGVLGNVVEDRADIGITALYSWYHEYTFMDFSAAYIRTAITSIAPAPRLLSSWLLPIRPFSAWLWFAVFCTFVYSSIALFIVQKGSSDGIFLNTFGMMITQTQPKESKNWHIRYVTGWTLITGLVIDSAYGGGLASSFTIPKYENSIDTIQELIESPLTWAATHDAWTFSLLLSDDSKIIQLINKFETFDSKTLRSKSLKRNNAFSIEKLPAGSFAIGDYIQKDAAKDLEIMLEEYYWEQCVAYARKSSPYTAKINELVGRLHESGIILAWETQVALKYLDYWVQLEVKLSRVRRETEVRSLQLERTMGMFIIYGLGCTTSILMFIAELLYYKRKKNLSHDKR